MAVGGLRVLLKRVRDQEHPDLGDGLVILHVRALGGGKVPERLRHALRGFGERKPPRIDPCHADVVNVVEIRERARLKPGQEFVVGKL